MTQSTGNKAEDTENGQDSVNAIHRRDSNYSEVKPIDGTPFNMVATPHGYFIGMAEYRLTEPEETEEKAMEHLLTDFWRIVVTLMSIVYEKNERLKKENQVDRDIMAGL